MKRILVFTVDSPELEGVNNFGLGNVIKNLYRNPDFEVEIHTRHISAPEYEWSEIAKRVKNTITPDTILHSHDVKANIPCFILKKEFPHVPWIHSFHYSFLNRWHKSNYYQLKDNNSYFRFEDRHLESLEVNTCLRADYLVFNSHFMKRDFSQRYESYIDVRARHKTVSIIPNGYDKSLFYQVPQDLRIRLKTKYSLPLQKKIIIFFGRFDSIKGFELVRNMGFDRYISNNYAIVLIGNSSLKKRIIYKLWKTPVYEFPKMKQTTLNELINVSDYAVFPSIYEPFGQAALETVAVGSPLVLVSANNGYDEFICEGDVFLDKLAIHTIVQKIRFFDRHPNDKKALVAKLKEGVEAFEWSRIKPQYNRLYLKSKPINVNYHLIKEEKKILTDNFCCIRNEYDVLGKSKRQVFQGLRNYLTERTLLCTLWDKSQEAEIEILTPGENVCYEFLAYSDLQYETVILDEILQIVYHPERVLLEAIRVSHRNIILIETRHLKYIWVDSPPNYDRSEILRLHGYCHVKSFKEMIVDDAHHIVSIYSHQMES